jgi:hypothetical protein
LYTVSGQNYYSTTSSAASINYNQQNGQPIANAVLVGITTAVTAGNAIHELYSYKVGELSVPSNTVAIDYLGVGIYNATPTSSPELLLNYSIGGQPHNVSYTSTQGTTIGVPVSFRTEKGSKIASITPSTDTFDMATAVDQLQFSVSATGSNTVVSKSTRTVGPYTVGQATNLPNVTIAAVNATPVLSGQSTYKIIGASNLTATPSVAQATVPVLLKNLSSTAPLVVLDSNANSGSNLILVGSGYVNSLSAQLESAYNLTSKISSGGELMQAVGDNRILVAGYSADQTLQEANNFISQLYSLAGSS